MCESLSPGITVRPPSAITCVLGPRRRIASWSEPTTANRPPRIATAVADGRVLCIVAILPPVRMTSADAGTGFEDALMVASSVPGIAFAWSALLRHHLRLLRRLRRLVHHRVRVLDARAVRPGLRPQQLHQRVVVLLVGPVALPLE